MEDSQCECLLCELGKRLAHDICSPAGFCDGENYNRYVIYRVLCGNGSHANRGRITESTERRKSTRVDICNDDSHS